MPGITSRSWAEVTSISSEAIAGRRVDYACCSGINRKNKLRRKDLSSPKDTTVGNERAEGGAPSTRWPSVFPRSIELSAARLQFRGSEISDGSIRGIAASADCRRSPSCSICADRIRGPS